MSTIMQRLMPNSLSYRGKKMFVRKAGNSKIQQGCAHKLFRNHPSGNLLCHQPDFIFKGERMRSKVLSDVYFVSEKMVRKQRISKLCSI